MAVIARDNNATASYGTTTGPQTVSITIGAPKTVLWVAVYINNTSSDVVTGITAVKGGIATAMSRATANTSGAGLTQSSYLYYIANPDTGSNSVSVSYTGSRGIGIVASSYTGAAVTGIPDSSNNDSTTSNSPNTLSTTVVASNCWLVGAFFDGSVALTAGTGTSLVNSINSGVVGFGGLYDSNGSVGTGSQSLQVTWSNTTHAQTAVIASMAPAASFVVSDSETVTDSTTVVIPLPSALLSVHDTESVTDVVAGIAIKNYSSASQNAQVTTSSYKWLTSTLTSAQNSFTVSPYMVCQIIDQTFLINQQIVNNPGTVANGSSSDSCTAPDGSIWAIVDDSSGNLRVGQITNGNTSSQWTNLIAGSSGTIIAAVSTGWVPYNVGIGATFQLNASISCSEWIQGQYTIDIYYFKNVAGSYSILHARSTNSGSIFSIDSNTIPTGITTTDAYLFQLAAGTPIYSPSTNETSSMVFFMYGLGNISPMQQIVYSYSATSAMSTSFNGAWTSQYANTGEWNLHSFDVEYVNGSYYIIFSGYHSQLASTNSANAVALSSSSVQSNFVGNFGIYVMQLSQFADVGSPSSGLFPIWSEPRSLLTFNSSSFANTSQCLYPSLNYDGMYLWAAFRGDITTSISENAQTTATTNYYICRSLDFKNFDYPTTVLDTNGNSISTYANNGLCRYVLVGNQNNYYYLLGSNAIWQYIQNSVAADVSNDIISIQLQDQTGGASSINLTISNNNGKWAGPSPTGTNYQAIWKNGQANKNSIVYLQLGYNTSAAVGETVPRNVYYIQDITQNVSSTQNDLVIAAQDFNKLLSVTQSAYTYTYQGPDMYFDGFTSQTLPNWSAVTGTWTQSPQAVTNTSGVTDFFAYTPYTQFQSYVSGPGSPVPGSAVLSGNTLTTLAGFQISKPSVVLAASIYIPSGASGGAEYDFYPLYIDSNNYLQVQIIYNGIGSTAQVTAVVNGLSSTSTPITFTMALSTWYAVYINCYQYGSFIDLNIGGGIGGNDITSFGISDLIGSTTTIQVPLDIYQFSNGINPTIAIGTNGGFGGTSSFTTPTPTYGLFANLRFFQYTYSQTIQELVKRIGTLAHVFNYISENDVVQDAYNTTQWNYSGTFSLLNRQLNLGGQSFTIQNQTQYSDGQIEFDAAISTTATENIGFDVILRSQDSNDLNNCYKIRFMNSENNGVSAINVVKVSLLMNNNTVSTQKIDEQLFSSIIPDQLGLGSQRYNTANGNTLGIDLTQQNHYQIGFSRGFFYVYINSLPVLFWYDNNNWATYSTGYWGFSTVNTGGTSGLDYPFTSSQTVYIKNIHFSTFWQQINSFSVNPGDDLTSALQQNLQTVYGWFFSDLGGRLKTTLLKTTDPVSYNYGDNATNYVLYSTSSDSSDKEYYNQVLVVGEGVSYLATDASSVGSNGILREEVIVDYTITTLQDAITRATQELSNIQKYGAQPAPQLNINVGSEVFDVVEITDQSTGNATGLNGNFRIYTQNFTVDNQSNYNVTLGTGTVTSNS